MNCKNCKTPMNRVFSYGTDGVGHSILECPRCGASTKPRKISFTDEGNVVLAADKNGNPTLAYQVADKEKENYGDIIKIKPKVTDSENKPAEKKKKPFRKKRKEKKPK